MVKKWLKADAKTHSHNQKVLRKLFANWSASKIKLGNIKNWKKISKNNFSKKIKEPPHLIIDSTDFRQIGKKNTSKKSEK